ncbi:hypothetical protein GCM10011416_04200 [Polaribacter pacificus]|uniref:Uncharacterized protein n=1 Tax=Polaribacter pacificus TaxID=1775173 RepID=A0A917HVN1_9FLAO|nr:hypothetical protein GCM10011416_04200 [Polaribacter pacificus]
MKEKRIQNIINYVFHPIYFIALFLFLYSNKNGLDLFYNVSYILYIIAFSSILYCLNLYFYSANNNNRLKIKLLIYFIISILPVVVISFYN